MTERQPKINEDDVKLPLFVYGTLMKGFYNFELIENDCELVEDATLSGFSLFDTTNGGFPFMCEVKSDKGVQGQLMYIKDSQYLDCFVLLDTLERAYARIQVDVDSSVGKVRAWTYVSTGKLDKGCMIKSNSWKEYVEERSN